MNCEVVQGWFYALYMFFFFVPYNFVLAILYMMLILNTFLHFVHQSSSFISDKIPLKIDILQGVIHD